MRTIYLILTFVCCIIAKAETFPYRSIASLTFRQRLKAIA